MDSRSGSQSHRSEILDRLPPQSIEAEKAVLGSVLLDPIDVRRRGAACRPHRTSTRTRTRCCFATCWRCTRTACASTSRCWSSGSSNRATYEAVGEALYLADVAQSVPTAANAVYYANIVRDKATLRALIHASTEILRDAYDQSSTPARCSPAAEEKVFRILEDKGIGELAPISEVLTAALAAHRRAADARWAVGQRRRPASPSWMP